MINKNLINLILISFSVLVIVTVVKPAYNGDANNFFSINGAVQSYFKYKNISNSLLTAQDLNSNSLAQTEGFKNTSIDNLLKLDQSMPLRKDIIRNINDVSNLAKDNKLKITSIKFTKPLQSKNIKIHVLSVSANGDYFAFSNFLKKLETSLELYNIKSLNINSDPVENTLSYSFTIETYENNK